MSNYVCTICGYVYVPADGCPEQDVQPGTDFNDVDDSFVCPICGAGKEMFEEE